MTVSQQTSTLAFVPKRVTLKSPKKYTTMTPEEKKLWLKYFTRWHWRAIAALFETTSYNPSLRRIADLLDLDLRETVDAVEGLETLGIVRRLPNGRFERIIRQINVNEMGIPEKEILRSFLVVGTEISSRLTNVSNSRTEQYFLATNRDLLAAHIQRVTESYAKLCEESVRSNATEVFGIHMSFVSFTPPDGTDRFGKKRKSRYDEEEKEL